MKATSLPVSLAIFEDTRLVFVNSSIVEVIGYYPEEIPSDDPFFGIVPEDFQIIEIGIKQQLSQRDMPPCKYIYRMIRKDGSIIWAETQEIMRFGDSKITTLVLTRQIPPQTSARYEKAEALTLTEWLPLLVSMTKDTLAQQKMLDVIWQKIPDGMVFLDQNGYVVKANPAVQEFMNLQGLDLVRPFFSYFPDVGGKPFTLESYQAHFFGQNAPQKDNLVRVWVHGRKVYLRYYYETIQDLAHERLMFLVLRDDTQRVLAEKALKDREERYDLAMRGSNDGLWDWDLRTNEVYYSPRWMSMLGYAHNELPHHYFTFAQLLHPDDQDPLQQQLKGIMEGRLERLDIEFRLRDKSGAWRPILSRAYPQFNHEGQIIRLVGTHVDLTEIRRAEEELRALNALKDKLFSIISHDLYGPLKSLMGLLQLAKQTNIPEQDWAKLLSNLSDDVQYTTSLLRNLLEWSKTQLQGEEFQPKPVNIFDITNNALYLLERIALQKEIRLENRLTDPEYVWADEQMLATIIRNLLNNSIKFCRPADRIIISKVDSQPSFNVFCVEDTGVGIEPSRLKSLFIDVNSTRGTNNEKGTGIGLRLCKDFIQKNKGEMWVESELGRGTLVYFTLPNCAPLP